jgi:3-hydroxy-9,10-secoandrosta-1,3,5(10)-triene-9,17-dione monooxygenase
MWNVEMVMVAEAVSGHEELDVVGAARALVPVLRERVAETDRLARLPDATVADLETARLFELTTPRCYGGVQSDVRGFMDAMVELGRGDASVAWTAMIINISNWFVATLYPPEVSDVIFAQPGVRIAAVLQPRTCKARRVEGGVLIEEGLWGFNSGVYHAHWDMLGVPVSDGDGVVQSNVFALLPMSQVKILDDWNTIGIRGSGSSSVAVRDVFVPDSHLTDASGTVTGDYRSTQLADDWLYRAAFTPLGQIVIAFPALGAGLAALDIFMAQLPKRAIAQTGYKKQIEAPITHLQLGEATAKIDAARVIIARAADEIERHAKAGLAMEPLDRARIRRDTGFADRLIWEGVDMLADASGGSFASATNPLNRVWQNARIASLHGSLVSASVYELYGRMMCGLDTNGMNI